MTGNYLKQMVELHLNKNIKNEVQNKSDIYNDGFFSNKIVKLQSINNVIK